MTYAHDYAKTLKENARRQVTIMNPISSKPRLRNRALSPSSSCEAHKHCYGVYQKRYRR
jgi:hypothetical protein